MLVIGATGDTGRVLVDRAVSQGVPVNVLVRSEADANSFPASVDVHVGDVRDPSALDRALPGTSVVVSLLGVRRGQPVGTVRSDGTRAIVEAMQRAGVRRLVAVSTVGVGSSTVDMSPPTRWLWPVIVGRDRLSEAAASEAVVTSSGLDWTLVRPPRLVAGPADRQASVGRSLPIGLRSQISRAALAEVLLDIADDPAMTGATVTVRG